MKNNTY